jgi:uncharacterized membrane protein
MTSEKDTTFLPLRFFIAAGWLFLVALTVAAPVLAHRAHFAGASAVYFLFSAVCHQIPERSFAVWGLPFAVCHRCLGIYLGLAIGSLIKFPFGSAVKRRLWIAAASLPLLIDAALPFTGMGNNVPAGRFLTGLLFGTMLGSLFLQGILELTQKVPRQRLTCKGEVL